MHEIIIFTTQTDLTLIFDQNCSEKFLLKVDYGINELEINLLFVMSTFKIKRILITIAFLFFFGINILSFLLYNL